MKTFLLTAALLCAAAGASAAMPRAEVVHWWISGGESAAIKVIAARYRAAGGVWIDSAVDGADQARAVAVNRILGGNPPAAAQFNLSKQFTELIEEGMLSDVDALARKNNWDATLPDPVRSVLKIGGHYYAVPVSLHIITWIWYSKAAFKKAGIHKEPATMDELFAALDRLKAAGIIPLAHGGQPWQENVMFMTLLSSVGGKDLYLRLLRDRDPQAPRSPGLRNTLLAFKRLHGYIDAGAPGRNWNDATALLLRGRAGVQIQGDWVKGEIVAAGMQPGRDIGCMPGIGPNAPAVVQGDAFIFPKSERLDVQQAQKLLADVMAAPATQVAFSRLKGSVPLDTGSLDPATLDTCTQTALGIIRDRPRQVGNGETYITAGQNSALTETLQAYLKTDMPVEEAMRGIARALR